MMKDLGELTDDNLVKLISQVMLALNYLHNTSVMHRDVRMENIMVQ